jgi:hypothetical protein
VRHFTAVLFIFCIYVCTAPELSLLIAESKEEAYKYIFMWCYLLFFPLFYLALKVDKLKYRNKLAEDYYIIFKGEDK